LAMIDVESCGKSRVFLGGLAAELHRRNVRTLYKQVINEPSESNSEKEEA